LLYEAGHSVKYFMDQVTSPSPNTDDGRAILRLAAIWARPVPEQKKNPEQKSSMFMGFVPLFRLFRHF
jgi:hypothetical protein